MHGALRDLEVLVLDCQAGGATPAYGDLIEIGWAVCGSDGLRGPVNGNWIVPRTPRRIPGPIRELTGWNERCVDGAWPEQNAWEALQRDVLAIASDRPRAPTLIHYARFELPFLRDLHARLGAAGEFPFDTLCLHQIGARLFPDLPRRNIRALAGFLGHTPELMRRSAGHVEASAFIWRAVLPLLEAQGVTTWDALAQWIAEAPPATRRTRRVYPLPVERRRALPDRPGVYRFVRRNDDILYVGKAASLKKRIAGHFKSRGDVTERALELLSQVHDVRVTETPSILEAALLESDEIKRIDPPYNVQLRSGERRAWFARRDLLEAAPAPDDVHSIGPLPSQRALVSFGALIKLAEGCEASPLVRALALSVPLAYLPKDALWDEGYRGFDAALGDKTRGPAQCVQRAARALWLERGRQEPESATPDAPPDFWDLARVRRRLERTLVGGGLLLRRAPWLCLLANADIAYRERDMPAARALVLAGGEIGSREELPAITDLPALPVRRMPALRERQRAFDAAAYDRLRVLATELRRVLDEGGELAVRAGAHLLSGDKLRRVMSTV